MNRLFIVLLAICFLLPAGANAAECTYSSTRAFTEIMDDANVQYQYGGLDEDKDEMVSVVYSGNSMQSIPTVWYFNETSVSVRVWNIISYHEEEFEDVAAVCNALNGSFRFVRFYANTSDNTVIAAYDMPVNENTAGKTYAEMLINIVKIVDQGYSVLSDYSK